MFDDYLANKWFSVPWGKETFLGSNTYKRLLKRFTSQKRRERIYHYKCSKVDALSKGRSGVYGQEEACLKFSEAEGNIKAILINRN